MLNVGTPPQQASSRKDREGHSVSSTSQSDTTDASGKASRSVLQHEAQAAITRGRPSDSHVDLSASTVSANSFSSPAHCAGTPQHCNNRPTLPRSLRNVSYTAKTCSPRAPASWQPGKNTCPHRSAAFPSAPDPAKDNAHSGPLAAAISSSANSCAEGGIMPRRTISSRNDRHRSAIEKPSGHKTSHWPHSVQLLIIVLA